MKVAISTDNGNVSAHFGRCQSYTIFEVKEGKIINKEIIQNPGHQPGFLPKFLAEKGVNCIITGGMGPRAQSLFMMKGIETIVGASGKVDDVIQKFIKNELEIGESQCTHQKEEMHCHHHSKPVSQKICITSKGKDLNAEVDPRFGRAQYFVIVHLEKMEFEAIENPNIQAVQGAGTQAAQFIASKGVDVVLTGNLGPNAYQILQAGGIKVITGVSGIIKDVIEQYKSRILI